MTVKVGVLVHADFGEERPADLGTYLRRFVETVEAHGLDALHIPTEIGWDRYAPLTMLGALAAWTERVQIGTCVLLAPLHDPLQLAEAVAAAQVVSGGRVVLGLGMGWRPEEFDAAGVALDSRLGRLQDHLAVLPRLLSGEEVTYEGRHHNLQGVRVGLAEGSAHVPIWLGSHGRPGIARAARRADAWIAGPFTTAGSLAKQVAVYRDALEEAGRSSAALPVMRECYVAESRAAAWREAEPMRTKYQEYAARLGAMPFDASAPLTELAKGRFVIGDPDDCAEGLAHYVEANGVTDLILRMQFRGMDPEGALRTVALLGDEVVPRLRARLSRQP
jgi:alkanesulfonate monooxygenase SsuD/methylene tetrahydromethanopterin reductase-like flavin-dependent oxidoreductase (luciferase family)